MFDYVDGGADDESRCATTARVGTPLCSGLVTPSTSRSRIYASRPWLRVRPCRLCWRPLASVACSTRRGAGRGGAAAGEAGIGFCMSSFSGYACETVAARAKAPLWYQLYLAGGREVTEAALARVWQARFQVLAVTIDTNAPGGRERDLRNGVPVLMSGHYLRMLPYLPAVLHKLRWTAQFLADRGALFFPNIQLPGQGACPAADVRAMLTGAVRAWADFTWIRQAWPGPILAKGVLTADDTRRAFDTGCAGVIVSITAAASSIPVLPRPARSPKWCAPRTARARCWWMAASAAAATYSKPSVWARMPGGAGVCLWVDGRRRHGRGPRDHRAQGRPPSAPWPCSAVAPSESSAARWSTCPRPSHRWWER